MKLALIPAEHGTDLDAPSRGHDLKLLKGILAVPLDVDAPSRGHDLKPLLLPLDDVRHQDAPSRGHDLKPLCRSLQYRL